MTIVVVADTHVEVYKSWTRLKKDTTFKKSDFAQLGTDYVLNLTDESYQIALDIKQLETVAAKRVFTKDRMSPDTMMQMFTLILVLIMAMK